MASLMDRLRQVFGVEHGAEHDHIQRRLDEQKLRIARLDADLDARLAKDRRRVMLSAHPERRAEDAR